MRVSTEVATKYPLISVTSESDNRTQTEPAINTNDDAIWSQGWRNGVAISGENDSVIVVGHDPAMFHFHGEFLLFLISLDLYTFLGCIPLDGFVSHDDKFNVSVRISIDEHVPGAFTPLQSISAIR